MDPDPVNWTSEEVREWLDAQLIPAILLNNAFEDLTGQQLMAFAESELVEYFIDYGKMKEEKRGR